MRAAAAKAAQERDAKARSMVDKRARSMAENSEMQALKRIDNSGMKQYDMKKGPPARSFGIATPTRPTRLPQKRPCSDFGNGYRDDGMGCWLGDVWLAMSGREVFPHSPLVVRLMCAFAISFNLICAATHVRPQG